MATTRPDMLPAEALTALKRVVDETGLELVVRLGRTEEEAWVLRPASQIGVKLDRAEEPKTSRMVAVTAHPPWVRGEIAISAHTLRGAVEQVLVSIEQATRSGA